MGLALTMGLAACGNNGGGNEGNGSEGNGSESNGGGRRS